MTLGVGKRNQSSTQHFISSHDLTTEGWFELLQQYPQFARLLLVFAGVAVPAACVNSGLKYFQKRIQLTFMRRLTHNLHQQYTANRAYYAASTLGGERCVAM